MAYDLAKLACKNQETIWVENYPPAIASPIDSDCNVLFEH